MEPTKTTFSLLSLNTFGIPFFLSFGRLARMAKALEGFGTNVVCLQEIQQNAYISILAHRLKTYSSQAIIPHVYAPKGGLGTFSRLPLNEVYFEPYRDRGLQWLITIADWALYKGMLVTRMQYHGLEIVVLNTHLNANYTGSWSRTNPLALTQYKQVQQIMRLINQLPEDALVILCGDFNFPRASYLYEELVSQIGLIDPLLDDPRPTYRPFPLVSSQWKTSLDYILLRLPRGKECNVQADIAVVEEPAQKNPIKRFLTDHCALILNVSWQ